MESQFIRQQKEFPSTAHHLAWYLGASLLPYEEVIPGGLAPEEAQALAAGEESLHAFFRSLYNDMYQNPKSYLMVEAPDLTYNDGEWDKDRPDVGLVKAKNAHVMKALEVLFEIGCRAALEGDQLALPAAEYDQVLAEMRPASISRSKVKGFLAALRQAGLEMTAEDGRVTLRSAQHPQMLRAVKALCQHGGRDARLVRFFAFYRCDYKAVEPAYTPDIAQVLSILPPETRQTADRIIAKMLEAGYKMALQMGGYPSDMWVVKFSGNKKIKADSFFWIGYSINFYNSFHVELHCANPKHLIPVVYAKGEDTIEWFSQTWTRDCDTCGYCKAHGLNPGPRFVVKGKERGLCQQLWLGARNPSKEQVDSLLKMVALHTEAGMTVYH